MHEERAMGYSLVFLIRALWLLCPESIYIVKTKNSLLTKQPNADLPTGSCYLKTKGFNQEANKDREDRDRHHARMLEQSRVVIPRRKGL